MSDFVSPLLQWLNHHPEFAGLLTFTISAAESVAIIGTIVPGSIMMTALGALAGANVIPLWQTIFWAILGAIVGDGISYWIGHYFKDGLTRIWPFRTHPSLLRTGELFFYKYGSMSVFIGRFVGPVRALVPVVAGMLGMRPLQFTIANVASAILWAPAYMLPGILLGAAALELPPEIAAHVMIVFLSIVLVALLCLWFIYKIFQLIGNQLMVLQTKLWLSLKKSRYFSSITVILKHRETSKTYGQFGLALLFTLFSILFLTLVFYIKIKTPIKIMANDVMFHLFRGLSFRSNELDDTMINITLLGQKQVILPLVVTLFLWLAFWKRIWTAFHLLALGICAAGSVFVIKHILKIPRPWGIFHAPETYSLPSGHTVLSTTIYLAIAFLIASAFKRKYRWPIYSFSIFMILAIAFSRLYLGVHWFTDIIAGWLLSICILLFFLISYQRQKERRIKPLGIFLVTLVTLFFSYSFYHYRHFIQLKVDFAQVQWPSSQIEGNTWWEQDGYLPAYKVSLFGYPSNPINIEWIGSLDQIKETLINQGWTRPPARNLISTFHRIADISSTEYLPMISPQYLDKCPALIMTRYFQGDKNLLVIRLWASNLSIKETNSSIWVGMIDVVPRSYSWLFKNRINNIIIDPSHLFPNHLPNKWEWKILEITIPNKKNQIIQQRIMLVRER